MDILKGLLSSLLTKERERHQKEAGASRVAIDSQSGKKVSFMNLDTGIDGEKDEWA
jgi:hypothetical protein